MSNLPLLSFVIPTYNSSNSITATLDSICNQELSSLIEIVVVDDCSTDNTHDIVDQYRKNKPNIFLTRLQKNSGPGIARDTGVLMTSSKWISFIDSDDQVAENFISTIKDKIATDSQSSDLIVFNYSHNSHKEKAARDDLKLFNNGKENLIQSYLLNKIENLEMLNLFKKDFLVMHTIKHRKGIHEDIDFLFECFFRAQKIDVIDQILYHKSKVKGSIMDSFSTRHISGYFDALKKIHKILNEENSFEQYQQFYKLAVVNLVASRLLMLVNNKHNVTESVSDIYSAICDKTKEIADDLNISPKDFLSNHGYLKTKYQMIFEKFLYSYNASKTDLPDNLLLSLNKIKNKSWSCYDLHNSVFLAPDEIRTCCKRYYHNGELKGDVVLYSLEKSPDTTIFYDNIKQAKNKLHKDINRNSAPECEACPFLKFDNWNGAPLSQNIKYLSLEYHSLCNMRCTYCSDTFYGGKKSYYDINKLIDSFIKEDAIKDCDHIVWGGGEPTVDPNFPKLFTLVSNNISPNLKQRVISNCTLFSEPLATQIENNKAYIVVSIDAGTQATFEKVRKYKYFDKVLENVQRYSKISPQNVIIKYIITKENYNLDELKAFASLIKEKGLQENPFHISYNFYHETIEEKYAIAIVALYALLIKNGASYVFLDDLIWQRFTQNNKKIRSKIVDALSDLNISQYIAEPEEYPNIVVWGTGRQYELLAKESYFLSKTNIEYFVDTRPDFIGKKISGKTIYSPQKLLDDNLPIAICAVQAAPLIYQQTKQIISDNRIIKKIIL